MNNTAAPTLFDVPYKFDQSWMGCRRSEEEIIWLDKRPKIVFWFSLEDNLM
jgi:hypothetical protein